ncbi:hypothetical protein AKJ09_00338 [Labilithrix luteola]|uniref:Lipoprotein n=1 Tax=Labilithrix luteola TaxID=1391654 RepID=A0A0K1PKN6_9BACT|nr:hypothetical protein [Labilithrix luteola]AKU93674.1 hypothetical protein AKJ09_00338 [Labilithrix luteola]
MVRARYAVRTIGVVAPSALVLAVACSSPYGEAPASPATGDAASSEATSEHVDAAASEPCQRALPKGLPATDDDPMTELEPFVIAVDTLDFTKKGDAKGFDLDGVCTCDTRPGNAHQGSPSCRGKEACDGEGGIDNAFGDLIASIQTDVVGGSSLLASLGDLSTDVRSGWRSVLLYLLHYNGLANDREVEIGLIPSDGIRSPTCPGSKEGTSGNFSPGLCGDDAWSTTPKGFIDGTPALRAVGYVNDYQLVGRAEGKASVPFGAAPLELGAPLITGKIVPLGEDMQPRALNQRPTTEKERRLFRIDDGQLVGRLPSSSLLATVGNATLGPLASKPNERVCMNPVYLLVRTKVCSALDVAASPSFDFYENFSCDAISAGLTFTAKPAVLGPVYEAPPTLNDCYPVDGKPTKPTAYAPNYLCP